MPAVSEPALPTNQSIWPSIHAVHRSIQQSEDRLPESNGVSTHPGRSPVWGDGLLVRGRRVAIASVVWPTLGGEALGLRRGFVGVTAHFTTTTSRKAKWPKSFALIM